MFQKVLTQRGLIMKMAPGGFPLKSANLILLDLLEKRRMKYPSYSLRRFAKASGLSPATVCKLMSGKRPVTYKSAVKISEGLSLLPDKKRELIQSIKRSKEHLLGDAEEQETEKIEIDNFKLISDWYHYAILTLIGLKNHKGDPEWIAKRLNITKKQATDAIKRLLKLGLIAKKGQKFIRITKPLVTSNDVSSSALRKHHTQNLRRAEKALEEIPVEWREFGSMTLTMDPKQLPKAKQVSRQFRQRMATLCEKGDPKMVYTLCTQLFPVNDPKVFLDSEE